MVMVEHVAEDKRRRLEPRHARQRHHVGLHDEVAVALLPVGDRVARHRLHIDVVGKEIVAAMRLLVRGGEEVLRLEALADQPPLHVDEAGEHRVDLAARDGLLELVECQVTGH